MLEKICERSLPALVQGDELVRAVVAVREVDLVFSALLLVGSDCRPEGGNGGDKSSGGETRHRLVAEKTEASNNP